MENIDVTLVVEQVRSTQYRYNTYERQIKLSTSCYNCNGHVVIKSCYSCSGSGKVRLQ